MKTLILASSTNIIGWATIGGGFVALLAVILTIVRLPMEREAFYVSTRQGAATIINDMTANLQAEVARLNGRVKELEDNEAKIKRVNATLYAALRRADPDAAKGFDETT